MSKPGVPLDFTVERQGVSQPLHFVLQPRRDPQSGLLGIGISPGASTVLLTKDKDEDGVIEKVMKKSGLTNAGVTPGMKMVSASGAEVQAYHDFADKIRASNGDDVPTTWTS